MRVTEDSIKQSIASIQDRIPIEELVEFSQIVCKNLIAKYGKQSLREDISGSSGNTEINNNLTLINEIGTLYLLSNRGMISRDSNELFFTVLGVSFTINRLMATEFSKTGVLPPMTPVIYSISAQEELVKRIIKLCKRCYLNYNFLTRLLGNRSVCEMVEIYLDPWYINPDRFKPL